MRPEGHLTTAAGAAGLTWFATGSLAFTAGVFAGVFLIDLDHYLDYLVVERQWSMNPVRFLDYYLNCKMRYAVLPLHSYELLAALAVAAYLSQHLLLIGYLVGATMHLALDIMYNGHLRNPLCFYSFLYRLSHQFQADGMIQREIP